MRAKHPSPITHHPSPAADAFAAVRRQALSASLIEFTKLMYPGYRPAPFHLRIAAELEAVARGETRYLAIMLPPRHGKSLLSSQHFPAWYLGTRPDKRIIACSYGDDLAHTFSRHARNMLLDDRWPFPEVKPAPDARAIKAWDIAGHRGGYRAAGVGSGITGHGANCLVGETQVVTPLGTFDIGTLHHERYRGLILAFDHEKNIPVWRRVVSSRELLSDEIFEFVASSGRRLRCTPDHRIFVVESGYRPASLLGRGERIISEVARGAKIVPGVQWPDEQRQQNVLAVLSDGQKLRDNPDMRAVRQRFRTKGLRLRQTCAAGIRAHLLLEALPQPRPWRGHANELLPLRAANSANPSEVLLTGVPGAQPTSGTSENLRAVRQSVASGAGKASSLLLARLRLGSALKTDARHRKLALQARYQLRQVVYRDAPADPGTRRPSLRRLRISGRDKQHSLARQDRAPLNARRPSHQRTTVRQHAGKSDHPLQNVPHHSPQVTADTVALVRQLRIAAEPVYDLQVEGTSNFFANGILVHNCLLIDDAVKDKEQADSALMREKTWDWYQSTSYTRLDPSGGAVVLIGTRWHADDLIGRALRDGDYWRVLSFPAEAEAGDALGRQPGEWLWPEQFSPERYQEIRARVGPRNWSALYQQRPSTDEGAMFPRSAWRSYRPGAEPLLREIVIAVDSAFKEGVGSDYSVFAVWGADGLGSYYVLDRVKERMEFPELIATGHRIYAQWRQRAGTRKVSLLVEDRASGQSAIQVWSRVSYGPSGTLPALPVIRWNIPAGRSKASRADEVTHLILAGRVYLPENTPWVADFVQEHVEFPHGPHDDQVDTTSQALGWFLNQPKRGVITF